MLKSRVDVFVDMAAPSRLSVRVEQFIYGVDGLQADCAPKRPALVEDHVFNWVDGGNGVAQW